MCGIFGFVAEGRKPSGLNVTTLQRVAIETERRGDHAFGFAWIGGDGKLRSYKQAGPISDNLYLLDRLADARMVIGHCRWATHGRIDDNSDNHPHPVDGGWLVHNGVIRHHANLVNRYDLAPTSQCDSEVLGLLIEHLDGTLIERVQQTVRLTATAPLALLGLWRSPQRLIMVRAGNPLYLSHHHGSAWFASQPAGLPGKPIPATDRQGLSFAYRAGRLTATPFPVKTPQQVLSATTAAYGA